MGARLWKRTPLIGVALTLAQGCGHGTRKTSLRPAPVHARVVRADGSGYHCPPKEAFLKPVVWDDDAADQRWYWLETDLTRVHTTVAHPVEVCGVWGQVRWLLAARCPDGSHPFGDPVTAHRARVGSVGAGGRCGTSIIDMYRIPCAGRTFTVFMDLYNCRRGESMFKRLPSAGEAP